MNYFNLYINLHVFIIIILEFYITVLHFKKRADDGEEIDKRVERMIKYEDALKRIFPFIFIFLFMLLFEVSEKYLAIYSISYFSARVLYIYSFLKVKPKLFNLSTGLTILSKIGGCIIVLYTYYFLKL